MPNLADRLTPADMAEYMRDLATNFGGKKDLDQKTVLYFRLLQSFPSSAVQAAVNRCLEEQTEGGYKFPLVGRLKAYARDHLRSLKIEIAGERIDEAVQCIECHEHLAYHRVIRPCGRSDLAIAMLAVHQLIRHRDGCLFEPRQFEHMQRSQERFADPETANAGEVELLDDAHKYVDATIGPLPPTLQEVTDLWPYQRPAKSRTPNPYPQPVALAPLAAVVPVVQTTIEQGDAYEEEPRAN